MTFDIYRIYTRTTPDNRYKINRDEDWTTAKVKTFDKYEDAEEYVIDNSMQHTEMVRFTHSIKNTDAKEDFKKRFCFTEDKYMVYRRYFIGLPPITDMRKALKDDGIMMINR
jgi:hypothetical protein